MLGLPTETKLHALFKILFCHLASVRFIYIKRRVWKSESNMDSACKHNINSFIEASSLENIDHILNQFECDTEEEQLLKDYLKQTSSREQESARMYLFLMLCHFFKPKITLKSKRWNVYLKSHGFNRLVVQHLDFNMQCEEFVDECFKLWTISQDSSSILQNPCKT